MIGVQCATIAPPPQPSQADSSGATQPGQQQQQEKSNPSESSPAIIRRSTISSTSSLSLSASLSSPSSSSPCSSSSSSTPMSSPRDTMESRQLHHNQNQTRKTSHLHHNLPQLSQRHQHFQSPPPSLLSHINLLNQQRQQQQTKAALLTESSSTRVPTPTTTTNTADQFSSKLARPGHQQEEEQQQQRLGSPGYHSAASSPGSSISSPTSSVASTASSTSGLCSSFSSSISSAISTASLTTASCPITVTASTTTQLHNASIGRIATGSSHTTTTDVSTTIPGGTREQQQQKQRATIAQLLVSASTSTASGSTCANQPSLLDYYPEMGQDGAELSWFHDANSRASLSAALASVKLIVSGDISLAEMSRYPVPIMARPPLGVSDLTLENWLSDVCQARKGIKLTFTSTRTVEPAFRVLARHAEHLKGPLILSADILSRPPSPGASLGREGGPNDKQQHQPQPVDAWTFLMLCRTRFPKSIISIGWCSPTAPSQALGLESLSVNKLATSSILAPADSSSAATDSMFELDLMMDQQLHSADSGGATLTSSNQHHRFNSPALHLTSGQQLQQHQQNRHQSHTSSSASSLQSHYPLVQQLAAVAVANNSGGQPQLKMIGQHQRHLMGGAVLLQQHRSNQHHSSGSLSSTCSLNSSSGNSSGSPSPTSPLGHLVMSPSQRQQHHSQISLDQKQQLSPEHQKVPGAGWPTTAAAAAIVAASTASLQHELELEHERDQLPLNLNINEADPQHTNSVATLEELAQTIRLLQRHSDKLDSISSSLARSSCPQLQQPTSEATAAALALASKLFGNNPSQHLLMNQVVPKQQQQQASRTWEHISKKAALCNRLNSNSPSPVSTSPKEQHQATGGNLLCVRRNQADVKQQLTKQQQMKLRDERQQQPGATLGYTREMIDKMASLVKEYNLTQPITFPVEAHRLTRRPNNSANSSQQASLGELQRLLYQVGANSTLTLVAQPEDLISVEDLLLIRKHFAPSQILFDLPDELAASLRQKLRQQ